MHIAVFQDALHEHRFAQGNAQAPALAHRVAGNPLVGAQILPLRADEPPAAVGQAPGADKAGVVPVRDKADLHAVRRVGAGQAALPGHLPDIVLFKFAQRQHQPFQDILLQPVEHIALVPGLGFRTVDAVQPVLVLYHPGVMPGGDQVDAQPVGLLGQQPELQRRVAPDAGVRGLAPAVAFAERAYHQPVKLLLRVDHVQGHPQLARGLLGGLHRALVGGGEADHRRLHRKPLLLQDLHADAAVHPAAQGNQNAVLLFKGGKSRLRHRSYPLRRRGSPRSACPRWAPGLPPGGGSNRSERPSRPVQPARCSAP